MRQKTSIMHLNYALHLSRSIGDSILEANVLNDISYDYGDYMTLKDYAFSLLRKSIEIRIKLGSNKVAPLSNMGWFFVEQGKWQEDDLYFRQAIAESNEKSAALYKYSQGRMCLIRENFSEAKNFISERIEISSKYQSKTPLSYIKFAQNYALLGDKIECENNMKISKDLFDKETVPDNKIEYFYEYAETCRLLEDYKSARTVCDEALTWLLNNSEEPDDYQYVAVARLIMGKILVDMQSYQEAVPHLDKARTAFAIGKHYALGETMLYLGKAHLGLGRRAEAENLLISALGEFQRLGLRLKEAEAKRLLGIAP